MTIRIPRPRLLLAVLAIVAIAGGAYVVGAQQADDPGLPDVTAIPVGNQPELPQVSPEEAARAREALVADEVFSSIAASTSWNVIEEVPNTRDGEKIGVAFIIRLDKPTESSGPWRQFRCQGTVVQEYTLAYENVTLLLAVFDASGTELKTLSPLPAASDQPLQFDESVEIPQPKCPSGSEEEGY